MEVVTGKKDCAVKIIITLAGNTKLGDKTINIVVDGNKMQSKLNCRHMDEEKPNTIYCGETEGSKCVCKQENSLPSAVTDYKALKRKWGTVVNKTLQHFPEANYVLESQKRWKHYDTVRKLQWTP